MSSVLLLEIPQQAGVQNRLKHVFRQKQNIRIPVDSLFGPDLTISESRLRITQKILILDRLIQLDFLRILSIYIRRGGSIIEKNHLCIFSHTGILMTDSLLM